MRRLIDPSQLRRVVKDVLIVLPFKCHLSVAPDDVHLEVTMYVLDRDYHTRIAEQLRPEQKPYVKQMLVYDMSCELLAVIGPEQTPTDELLARVVFNCVRTAVEHEVREGFYFRGVRIEDPHGSDGKFLR